MDEIERRKTLCEEAQNPDWESVAGSSNLEERDRVFLKAHPPGLVGALWSHFEATREKCGCSTPSHERSDCSVALVERLLRDEQSL